MLFAKIPDNLDLQERLVNEISDALYRNTGNDLQRDGHDIVHALMVMIATVVYRSHVKSDREINVVCENFKNRLTEAIAFMNRRGL